MSSPHDTLALVGTTIAEKYAVEAVVGEGGFACVYRAMHLVWKRPVAVKVFKALGEVPADQRGKLLEDFIQAGALRAGPMCCHLRRRDRHCISRRNACANLGVSPFRRKLG